MRPRSWSAQISLLQLALLNLSDGLILIALVAVCLLGTGCSENNTPPGEEPGRLVFAFSEPGDTATSLYVINADGSGRARLTEPGAFFSPRWSPDGRKIAYRVGNTDIGVVNANGTNPTTVWHSDYFPDQVEPSWSPDSRRLVFARSDGAIYTINADGSDLRQLTNGVTFQHSPAWSPDGNTIAFVGPLGDHTGIYTMNPDGNGVTLLNDTSPGDASQLSWSPDGRSVAYRAVYASLPGPDPANLEVFSLDGLPKKVLIESGYPTYPAWSPDGSLIAFFDDHFPFGIHLIHPDGTQPRGLTEGGVSGTISWAPLN